MTFSFAARVLSLALLVSCGDGSDPAASAGSKAPPSEEAVRELAETLQQIRADLEQGLLEDHRERLEASFVDHPDSGELCALLSWAYRLEGDTEQAVAWAETAIELDDDSSLAHHQHARALAEAMRSGGMLSALGKIGPFKASLDRTIELDPGNLEARRERVAYLLLAPGIAGGDKERAKTEAYELVELDRDIGVPLVMWSFMAEEREQDALELGATELDARPGAAAILSAVARVHLESERWPEADEVLAQIPASADPEVYFSALYSRAKIRLELGDSPRDGSDDELASGADVARELLEEYLRDAPPHGSMLPGRAAAAWRLGQAHEQLGDLSAARSAYEQALEHDDDFERAQDALDALP